MSEQYEVRNNEQQQQFEVHVDGEVAVLEYRFHEGNLALMHTQVPEQLEGRGIAAALTVHALEWARSHHQKVLPYCPYVVAYLKRHPGYEDILARRV